MLPTAILNYEMKVELQIKKIMMTIIFKTLYLLTTHI